MNNTQPVKVTLRPEQIEKVKKLAKYKYDGNFSLALRSIINQHKDS